MTEAPAAPARTVRLSRSARRAQLLVAAREVFAAQGYHAAAMDDIAERAGVSKPVLYQHFPGKFALYRALLTTCADDLVERVRDAIGAPSDNPDRVSAAVAAYFDFVAGDGQAYRRGSASPLRREPETTAGVDGALRRCVDAVAAAVTADAGLDEPRARLLAVGLVGLSRTAAQYWLDSDRAIPRDEAVALMSSLAWRGLAGVPGVPPPPPAQAAPLSAARTPRRLSGLPLPGQDAAERPAARPGHARPNPTRRSAGAIST